MEQRRGGRTFERERERGTNRTGRKKTEWSTRERERDARE